MSQVRFEGQAYTLAPGESVLDGLLRHGVKVSYSCKAGSCGSCLLQARSGAIPEQAQAGLKDSWKAQGYFLACVCHPGGDLDLTPADVQIDATIAALLPLTASVLEVRLRCAPAWEFRAGQYMTLLRPDGLARSYSIASLPEDGDLSLHVRLIPGGKMSTWLSQQARVGDPVRVLGPSGACCYVAGREEQPLLLAGTGTGLAPLYGIARDALRRGHHGPVRLFHGAAQVDGLYLTGELRALADQYPHFEYTPAVLEGGEPGAVRGPLDQVVLARVPNLAGWRGYVCGDPAFVTRLRKKLFLGGMASRDIYADAFLPSAS